MAAPDRVYRYFTNLKAKDNVNDVYFIRCAKPLLTYIPNGAVTKEQKEAAIKSLFKLDGILWLKNPDVPHSASDANIKVEVEDPTHPGQTIEIDDPDLGDPDRSGFIGYVFRNSDNAAFHDTRTGPINNGVQSIATDFSRRSWSRASRLRYREWFDPEVPNSDKGEAIILNDAGLNRRGECAVKDTQQHEEFTFDLYADGNCVFYYKGTYTAPIYNRATSWGIRYKTHAAPHIQNQAVLDEITANTIEENISIARGATLNFLTNPHPFKLGISDATTLTVGDYFYFAPFITNEEGTYELPVSNNTYAIVPRFKLKVKYSGGFADTYGFYDYLDLDAISNSRFDKESNEYLNISDDNQQNTSTPCGTMYFNSIIDSAGSSANVYDKPDPNNTDTYKNGAATNIEGYYYGPLVFHEDLMVYIYNWVLTEEVNDRLIVSDSGQYEPVIEGVQGIFINGQGSWNNQNHTEYSYTVDASNLSGAAKQVRNITIKLVRYPSGTTSSSGREDVITLYTNTSHTGINIPRKSIVNISKSDATAFSSYSSSYDYYIECTYDANNRQNITKLFAFEEAAPEGAGGEVMP